VHNDYGSYDAWGTSLSAGVRLPFGRAGALRVDGTRELVLAPLPFIAVYEVHQEEVQVLRLLHGAQSWPAP